MRISKVCRINIDGVDYEQISSAQTAVEDLLGKLIDQSFKSCHYGAREKIQIFKFLVNRKAEIIPILDGLTQIDRIAAASGY